MVTFSISLTSEFIHKFCGFLLFSFKYELLEKLMMNLVLDSSYWLVRNCMIPYLFLV